MLHLARAARSRVALPYVVAATAVLSTLWMRGATPFRYDGYWLQHLEVLLFLWLSTRVFRAEELTATERASVAAACAWLAMDELLMFHECVRMKFRLGVLGRDPLVVAYLLFALVFGTRIIRRLLARALPHLLVAALAAILAVTADVGGFGRGAWAHVLEESFEFLALAAAIATFGHHDGSGRLAAVGWATFNFGWMSLAFWLVRPWVCPARLL